MISCRRTDAGFTLIEIVMTIVLVAILGTVTASFVGDNEDSARHERTRRKLEAIRSAILGDAATAEAGGRSRFGYHGDMGRMPGTLTNLVTAEAPAYVYDSVRGFGSGWRGPYVPFEFTGVDGVGTDAWGRAFDYDASGTPYVRSRGSDGLVGGTGYGTDITIAFPAERRAGTVNGTVMDGDDRLSNRTVEIRYPVNGTQTAFTTTTGADGTFSFTGVPFGFRSVAVTAGTPAFSAVGIVVDGPVVVLPETALNANGGHQRLTHVGPVSTGCTNNSCAITMIQSTYDTAVQAAIVNIGYTQPAANEGWVTGLTLNGVTQSFPSLAPYADGGFSQTVTIPANSSVGMQINFARDNDGTDTRSMAATTFRVAFRWKDRVQTDVITFTTP